jgi:hypothetical protein
VRGGYGGEPEMRQRYVIISESPTGAVQDRRPVFITGDPGAVRAVVNYLARHLTGSRLTQPPSQPSVVPLSRPPGPTGKGSG